jgi:hypothetical protein
MIPPVVDVGPDRCQCGARVDLSVTVLWDRVQCRITGCPACHEWFRWGGRRAPGRLAATDDTPKIVGVSGQCRHGELEPARCVICRDGGTP